MHPAKPVRVSPLNESQLQDPWHFVPEASVPEDSVVPVPDHFDNEVLEGLTDPFTEEDGGI